MNTNQIPVFCRIALLFVGVLLVLTACGEQNTVIPAATSVVNPGIVAAIRTTPIAGKPGANSSTSNQLEACALVTQKEAEEALGGPVTVQRNVAAIMVFTECDYTIKTGNNRIRVELISKDANSYYTKSKKEAADYVLTDVAGLGDQAFKYSTNEGSDLYLTVLKGDNICRITVTKLADNDKQATALMQKAVGRLTNGGAVQPTPQSAASKTKITPVAVVTTAKSGSKTTSVAAVTTAKSGSSAPDGIIHVCTLLTQEEAAAVLSEPVTQVDASADAANFPQGSGTCNYVSESGGLTIKVNFSQLNKTDFEASMTDLNAQPVEGVGDTAFWGGNQLSILKGTVNLVIFPLTSKPDVTTPLDKAKAIAPKILGRLTTSKAAAALNSTAAPIVRTTDAEVPVYPGAQLVRNEANSFGTSNTYISTDSYAKVTGWIKKALEDKGWTSTYMIEAEPGVTIAVGGKATDGRIIQLTISGPQKAGRNAGEDAAGKQIELAPNSTMIELHFQ